MKSNLLTCLLFTAVSAFAQDKEFNLDKVYEISPGGKIEMSSDDADVTIIGSDRKDVHVKVHRRVTVKGWQIGDDDFDVEIFSRDGNLVIREMSRINVSMVGYRNEVYTIDIEVPYSIELDLKGDDGDFMIRNVDGDIAMVIDDGDAVLQDCDSDDFYFSLDDGNVKMDQGSGRLTVKMDDGDVLIDNGNFHEIDIRIDDGSVSITTSLAENGEYFFDGNDADLTFNVIDGTGEFDIRHDDTRVSFSRGFEVLVEEEDETRLKLGNGSAKIRIRTDDGRIRLSESSEI